MNNNDSESGTFDWQKMLDETKPLDDTKIADTFANTTPKKSHENPGGLSNAEMNIVRHGIKNLNIGKLNQK